MGLNIGHKLLAIQPAGGPGPTPNLGALYMWGSDQYSQLGTNGSVSAFSWTTVSAGSQHTLAIRNDGTLWAWGRNSSGQLGTGDTISRSRPVQVGIYRWKKISAGEDHTLGIRDDDTLWGWGSNYVSQLGSFFNFQYVAAPNFSYPIQITTGSWNQVSAGKSYSMFIRNDGILFGVGQNTVGILGDNSDITRSSPVQIGTRSWSSVSAGMSHTLAIDSTGLLFAWGLNNNGQLGINNTAVRSSPVQVGASSWSQVSCGEINSLGITVDSRLFSWGSAAYGVLGINISIGTRNSPVLVSAPSTLSWVSIAAGQNHCLAVTSSGDIYSWGRNDSGQLGINDINQKNSPMLVSSQASIVEAGYEYSTFKKTNDSLYLFGSNINGQLGDNT